VGCASKHFRLRHLKVSAHRTPRSMSSSRARNVLRNWSVTKRPSSSLCCLGTAQTASLNHPSHECIGTVHAPRRRDVPNGAHKPTAATWMIPCQPERSNIAVTTRCSATSSCAAGTLSVDPAESAAFSCCEADTSSYRYFNQDTVRPVIHPIDWCFPDVSASPK